VVPFFILFLLIPGIAKSSRAFISALNKVLLIDVPAVAAKHKELALSILAKCKVALLK